MPSRATRDLGLERIGRSTRWLAVGLLAGGGVLSAAVAKTLPGHSAPSHSVSTPPSPAVPQTSTGDSTPQQAPDTTPLTSPAQVPQTVSNPPVVSSGGS
jgi:multidrug efflux pump subunit AcrA (membrane-fusion protein)